MISRDPQVVDPSSTTGKRLQMYVAAGAHIVPVFFSIGRTLAVLWKGLVTVRPGWVVTCQDPFEGALVGWMIARLRGAAVEVQLHGDFFGSYWKHEAWHRPLRLRLARWVLAHVNTVRAASPRAERSLPPTRAQVVVITVPPQVQSQNTPDPTQPIILFAGRFAQEKNLPLLLEAFRQIAVKHPRTVLVLQGSGPLEAGLRRQVTAWTDHSVAGRVQIVPWDSRMERLARAQLCVMASRHEAWARFAVEAALAGCPVVMTDVGCAGEVIRNGESGWVVPVDDVAAFASALNTALADPQEAARRALRAQARARQLPSETETAKQIVETWQQVAP